MLIDDNNQQVDSGGDGAIDDFDNPMDALNAAAEEDERRGENEDGIGSDKKADATDTTIPPHIQAAIDKAHDEAIGAKQENQFLRGQVTTLQQQVNTPKVETKTEEKKPLFKIPTREEIEDKLTKSDTAADTILGMFRDLATSVEQRLDEVTNTTKQQFQTNASRERTEKAFIQDGRKVVELVGEDLARNNKDFSDAVDLEIKEMIDLRGNGAALPGDLYAGASRVYARWMKEGRIKNESANGNGNGNSNSRPDLRRIVRQVNGDSERMGSNGNGNSNGNARALRDLGFTPQEERVARLTMRKLGVTEDQFVKNYNAGRREDESYGK